MLTAEHMLAIGSGEVIEAVVMVAFMLLMAAGQLFKKKLGQGAGEKITFDVPKGEQHDPAQRSASPARPALRQKPVQKSSPPIVRPTPTQAVQQRPAQEQIPSARPRLIQPAAHERSQRVAQPARRLPQRPQPAESPQRSHRGQRTRRQSVTPNQHATQLAAHAAHVASQLKEQQLRKAGKLKPGEHAHGEEPRQSPRLHPLLGTLGRMEPRQSPRLHPLLGTLGRIDMKQAVVLSEIIKPPLALREPNDLF